MLWNLIRDYFVIHVFGGYLSNGDFYSGYIGNFTDLNGNYVDGFSDDFYIKIGDNWLTGGDMINGYISIGDWLSTTATIISISIIVVLCCLFVYKIIKLIGGLIR